MKPGASDSECSFLCLKCDKTLQRASTGQNKISGGFAPGLWKGLPRGGEGKGQEGRGEKVERMGRGETRFND